MTDQAEHDADAAAPAGDRAVGHAPGSAPTAAVERRSTGGRRRGDRSRFDVRLAVTVAAGLAGGLLLADLVSSAVSRLQGLIVTLLVSLFLSFALEPAVQWASQRGIRRGIATLLSFVVAFLLLAAFVGAMTALVVGQVRNLVDAGPEVLDDLARRAQDLPGDVGTAVSDWLMRQAEELPQRIPGIASQLGRGAIGVGSTVLGVIVQLLTMLLVTFYLVADGPRLRRTLVSRVDPARQREFLEIWELAISKTGGYVYSRVVTAVASAIFHSIAFTLIGIDYPFALGVFVGMLSSLVPVVGTYIAGALPLLVALAGDPFDALIVLIVIIVYQQIENYLIAPRINAATMALHPAVAFVSVLIGGALLGAAGALLALPATAIVAALVSAYGERHEVLDHGLVTEPGPRTAARVNRPADRS